MPRRLAASATLLIVPALLVCFTASGSAVRRRQPVPTDARSAYAAIAHGKRDLAEKFAQSRGGSDPLGATILAQLAIAKGQFREAQALLEPVVTKDPAGDAALE